MLQMRPNCECCDKDLPPQAQDAMICTFEPTFCADCVATACRGAAARIAAATFAPQPRRAGAHAGEGSGVDGARAQAGGLRTR